MSSKPKGQTNKPKFSFRKRESIAKRLCLLRTMHSLTETQVARQINVSKLQYRILEDGKSLPDYFQVRKLMNLYSCTSDYLLFGDMIGLKDELFFRLTEGAKANMSSDELREFLNDA